MKKWLLATFVILVILFAAVYLFIPSVLKVSVSKGINCTIYGSNRVLLESWTRWWPDPNQRSDSSGTTLYYNNLHYSIEKRLYNQFLVHTTNRRDTMLSRLTLVQLAVDSIHVFWEYDIIPTRNPIKRINNFLLARRLTNNSDTILSHLKTFLEKKENVYGFDIHLVSTPKTYLVATSQSFLQYPEMRDVYQMVEKLSNYAQHEHAEVTGYPMLNVTRRDSSVFETMVALPVDRQLPGKNEIIMRRIVTVKALGVKVQGGTNSIQKALHELERYVLDYRLFSPAIPYENMFTNRLTQSDTSKWITYIYQPLL